MWFMIVLYIISAPRGVSVKTMRTKGVGQQSIEVVLDHENLSGMSYLACFQRVNGLTRDL